VEFNFFTSLQQHFTCTRLLDSADSYCILLFKVIQVWHELKTGIKLSRFSVNIKISLEYHLRRISISFPY